LPAASHVTLDSPFPLRLPLLITGITGVAGWNALHYFQRRYPGQVIGIRPRQTWQCNGPGIVPLNAEDAAGLRELFAAYRFGAVLNCVGNCALKSCECDPAMARLLNVESAAVLSACIREHGSRLVHLSSDLVFSGKGSGGYAETDATDPVTVYGTTMVQGEQLLRDREPATAILRISLPMGPSFNGHAGAIDWIQSRFRNHRPATLYFDEVRSCTYTDDLNVVFERFLQGDEGGIYHLGGPRPVTLHQIGQIVNRVGGYDARLLKGCPRAAAGPLPPRAGNVSMSSAKLVRMLGAQPFQAWPVGKDIFPDGPDWHSSRRPGEKSSPERIRERLYCYPGRQPLTLPSLGEAG
jgi:dTDP-4-dehydrorhamnose reductase